MTAYAMRREAVGVAKYADALDKRANTTRDHAIRQHFELAADQLRELAHALSQAADTLEHS